MKYLLSFSLLLPGVQTDAQNNNCATAVQVCNDVTFSGNSSGPGTQELPNNNTIDGCLTIEHQSSWYYFSPVTSGTVALTIITAVDYDFAIWQAATCATLGSPVRCSYSQAYGNTGLASTNSLGLPVLDVSEGTAGDRWVMPLNVTAGQTYIMLIDNYTANSTPFTLDWTFYNGATLNCTPSGMPVELLNFKAQHESASHSNRISWETASERYNDYFNVERSTDMENWMVIHMEPGQELSTGVLHYELEDYLFEHGKINYYRLSQTDTDGTRTFFDPVAVNNKQSSKKIVKMYNAMGQEVGEQATGIVVLVFEDGTTQRVYR